MKKHLITIISILLIAMLFTGCAAKTEAPMADYAAGAPMEKYEDTATEEAAPMEEPMAEAESGGFDLLDNAEAQTGERKIIYTADYSISTENFDSDYNKVLAALESANGYLSSENTYGTRPEEYGDSGRSANFTLRIPIQNYANFLNTLAGIGTVESKSQYTEDVTTAYYDNEARIEFYEAHYEKLMDYLEKATEMEDVMSIEAQITETLLTLDSLKGTKSYYDNMTQYTTVHINLYEVVYNSGIPVSKQTLGQRISESFGEVLSALGAFFEVLLVVIIGGAPIWGVLLVIFLAIFLPIRYSRKKRQKKAEEANKTE